MGFKHAAGNFVRTSRDSNSALRIKQLGAAPDLVCPYLPSGLKPAIDAYIHRYVRKFWRDFKLQVVNGRLSVLGASRAPRQHLNPTSDFCSSYMYDKSF